MVTHPLSQKRDATIEPNLSEEIRKEIHAYRDEVNNNRRRRIPRRCYMNERPTAG